MRCPRCRFENPAGFKYCGECGLSLTDQSVVPDDHSARESERRQITVMFCDLVNSTQISTGMDPEQFHDLIRKYQEMTARVIQRFDGHIAQYLGDGIVVYYGYPKAHEDDAQRAIYAAEEIIKEIGILSSQLSNSVEMLEHTPLEIRIGIHSGPVMVGEVGKRGKSEHLALGDTPNIASRLQQVSEPNTVVISSDTLKIVEGYFEVSSLGSHEFKGLRDPIVLYQVDSLSGAPDRFEAKAIKGLSPFVGRDAQLNNLLDEWRLVESGKKRVVSLKGEVGIGKSRLIRELKDRVLSDGIRIVGLQCSPYFQNSSLYPVINYFEQYLEFTNSDEDTTKLTKMENFLDLYEFDLSEAVPLFTSLLSVAPSEKYPPLALSPVRQRKKTFEVLSDLLKRVAGKERLLFIVEDIHWADPSTLEFLNLLISAEDSYPAMILYSTRTETEPDWEPEGSITDLILERFQDHQSEQMVRTALNDKDFPDEIMKMLIDKSDGVPLYIEELTNTLVESGVVQEFEDRYDIAEHIDTIHLPLTLKDLLMQRIDNQSAAKDVAQLGSSIGREFSYELINEVYESDAQTLQNKLSKLVDAGLLYRYDMPLYVNYEFKHALIRDAAYESILRSKRKDYHRSIAEVLESKFPDQVESRPELVAHQYTEAGIMNKAVEYWQKAGQKSIESAAYTEGITHYNKGLDLLSFFPESDEKAFQEIAYRTSLGGALIDIRGYASEEIENQYSIANEIRQNLETKIESSEHYRILHGLWLYYSFTGKAREAVELAQQLVKVAENEGIPFLLIGAYQAAGLTYHFGGYHKIALDYVEKLREIYDSQKEPPIVRVGADPTVSALAVCMVSHLILGDPEKGAEWGKESIEIAYRTKHPYNIVFAKSVSLFMPYIMGDFESLHKDSKQIIDEQQPYDFPLFLATNTMFHGYSQACLGDTHAGLETYNKGFEMFNFIGTKLYLAFSYSLLAQIYDLCGEQSVALEHINNGLKAVDNYGDRCYEAELYRHKGEVLIKMSDEDEAEKCFMKSLEVAHKQQAKLWELRTTLSLCRLWDKQNKSETGKLPLAEILNSFSSDSNMRDVIEGQKLLESLL